MFGVSSRDILGFCLAIGLGTAAFMAAGPDLATRIGVGGGVLVAVVFLVLLRIPPDMVPVEQALIRRLRALRRPRRYVFRSPAPEPPPPPPPPPAPEPEPPPPPPARRLPKIRTLRLGPARLLIPAEALFWAFSIAALLWSALALLEVRP
jgi:hypothetical protein